jgi:hypothetical protein
VVHPLTNETGTGNQAEAARFSTDQVEKSRTIQFFEMGKAQQRPELAIGGGFHQLIQISQMSLKEFAGYADSDVGSSARRSITNFHVSPQGGWPAAAPYFMWMRGQAFLAQKLVKGM